jgi:hypothetical protein
MRWAKDAFYEKGAYGLPRADRIQTPFLRIPEPSFPDSKRFVSDYQHASAYWHNPPPTMPPPTMPPAEPAVHTSTLPDMRCSTLPRRCTPPSPGECAAPAPPFPCGRERCRPPAASLVHAAWKLRSGCSSRAVQCWVGSTARRPLMRRARRVTCTCQARAHTQPRTRS